MTKTRYLLQSSFLSPYETGGESPLLNGFEFWCRASLTLRKCDWSELTAMADELKSK